MNLFLGNSSDDSSTSSGSDDEDSHANYPQQQHLTTAEKQRQDDETHLHLLLYTFKLERGANEASRFQRIMELLRTNPAFASKQFQHEPYSSSATLSVDPYTTSHRQLQLYPFTYMLIGGATLDDLHEIYDMYPRVLLCHEQMPDKRYYLSIHTVCMHRSDETQVVRFVAERTSPERFACGLIGALIIPLHIALEKYAPLETIQTLVERNPDAIRKQNDVGMDCLQRAMWHLSPSEPAIIHYLADKFPLPKNSNTTDYRFVMQGQYMDLTCSQALAKLLLLQPPLERFTCKPGDWTVDALVYFLQCLRDNASISELELKISHSQQSSTERQQSYQALRDFFATNMHISSCKIMEDLVSVNDGQNYSLAIQAIQQGLFCNKNSNCFDKLSIGQFHLANSSDSIVRILSGASSLVKFVMEEIHFDRTAQWIHPTDCGDIHSCNIQELKISSCTMSVDFLCDMLCHISRMPHLQILTLEDTIETNAQETTRVTQALTKVLDENKLGSLIAFGMELDMFVFLRALQDCRSLSSIHLDGMPREAESACLDVLDQHNTAVINLKLISSDMLERTEFMAKIAYYTKLNEHGRAKVRSVTDISVDRFVDLLDSVLTDDSIADAHSVQYGLLRECPSIWCGVTSKEDRTRKRKRSCY